MDNNNTPENNNNSKIPKGGQTVIVWLVAAVITFLVIGLMKDVVTKNSTHEFTYSEFLDMIENRQLESVTFTGSEAKLEPTKEITSQYPLVKYYYTVLVARDFTLTEQLKEAGIEMKEEKQDTSMILESIISFVIPFIFIVVLMNFMMKRMGGGGIMGVGRSNA